jgi:hypothetical protein
MALVFDHASSLYPFNAVTTSIQLIRIVHDFCRSDGIPVLVPDIYHDPFP